MRCLFITPAPKFDSPECSICSWHFCNLLNSIEVPLLVINLLHGSPRSIMFIPVGTKVTMGRVSPPILPWQHGPVFDTVAAFIQVVCVARNLDKVACRVVEVGTLMSLFQDLLCLYLKQREAACEAHHSICCVCVYVCTCTSTTSHNVQYSIWAKTRMQCTPIYTLHMHTCTHTVEPVYHMWDLLAALDRWLHCRGDL